MKYTTRKNPYVDEIGKGGSNKTICKYCQEEYD